MTPDDLYDQYFGRIYAYVAYRIGCKQDVEDVVSEVFMRVVEKLPAFDYRGDPSLAAWLFRIAYSQVNQFYRDHPARREPLPLDLLPEISSRHPTPDQIITQKERFAQLRELITTLPTRRQEVVTLRFFGGLRNREIAEVLGLDERTVASHLSRALTDLQKHYGADQEKERLP